MVWSSLRTALASFLKVYCLQSDCHWSRKRDLRSADSLEIYLFDASAPLVFKKKRKCGWWCERCQWSRGLMWWSRGWSSAQLYVIPHLWITESLPDDAQGWENQPHVHGALESLWSIWLFMKHCVIDFLNQIHQGKHIVVFKYELLICG